MSVPTSLTEIVVHLQLEPAVCRSPAHFLETNRHLGRNPGVSINQSVQGVTRNAQRLRGIGNGQTQRLKAIEPNVLTGMRWISHTHGKTLSLVVVNQIDIAGIAGGKTENDSPVSRHAHCVNTPSVTAQFMQPEAGLSHVLDCPRSVKARQDATYLSEMAGIDTAGVVSEIQPFQSSMSEVFDHEKSSADT